MDNNNNNMIRLEKKAANKLGLLIVFALTIVGTIMGVYLLYENKDNLDFSLPWEEKEEEEIPDVEPPKKDENNTSGGRLYLPMLDEDDDLIKSYRLSAAVHLKNLQATTKGYEFDFVVDTTYYNATFEIVCTQMLIDGYEISPKFEINATNKPNTITTEHIIIPLAELENLEIRNFKNLSFFVNFKYRAKYSDANTTTMFTAVAFQDTYVDNNKEELASFAPQENVRISYHKKITTEDATYLYFVVNNTNNQYDFDIELNKLIIDNEIYNDIEVSARTHHLSKNVFFIKLPKKQFRKPKEATLSFVISRTNDKQKFIYITRDETITIAK